MRAEIRVLPRAPIFEKLSSSNIILLTKIFAKFNVNKLNLGVIMYICECGRVYENSQSFNGHKGHCKDHQIAKYGNLDTYKVNHQKRSQLAAAGRQKKFLQNGQQKLDAWIDSKPICEACGKVMAEKFGSGRFCSRSCANQKQHSDLTKAKIAAGVAHSHSIGTPARRRYQLERASEHLNFVASYEVSPKLCNVCGSPIAFEKRFNKTCGNAECLSKIASESISATRQRIGLFNGHVNYKWGWYKDIHCDSSWELAYIVYMLDHGHKIIRNTAAFPYQYKGKTCKYFPDFIEDNNKYVEIKNYWTDQVQAKIDCFPRNLQYEVLYRKDIEVFLDYCRKTYGDNFCEILYDKTRPSYLQVN